MNRRLAVPLAVKGLLGMEENRAMRVRILKDSEQDGEDLAIAMKLAENRVHIENLLRDISSDPAVADSPEIETDLDYVEASIQLGLLEISAELEEIPDSEEFFEEAVG